MEYITCDEQKHIIALKHYVFFFISSTEKSYYVHTREKSTIISISILEDLQTFMQKKGKKKIHFL